MTFAVFVLLSGSETARGGRVVIHRFVLEGHY